MTRGGRAVAKDGPERRCIVLGESGPTDGLVRFVLDPDGTVVPDLAERLPGRGAWVTADRKVLEKAVRRNQFNRAFGGPVRLPPDLAGLVEQGLARRLGDAIAMARKAGLATSGFDTVRSRLRQGPVAALIEASDGSEAQRAKLRPLAGSAARIDSLTATELGLAFGREFVIHAALDSGGAAERAIREQRRLAGFRVAPDAAGRPAPEP